MLKQTPLYEVHKKLGGRIVEFGGWEMPVQYSGIMEEHRAVRKACGLFDISHMGQVLITGPKALEQVNYLTTNDVSQIPDGKCQYTAALYPDGGVVDDLIVYRINAENFLIVVNASNDEKDFNWFVQNNRFDAKILHVSHAYGMLALQGPKAKDVLANLGGALMTTTLNPFSSVEEKLMGISCIISRTGYTGEDGFEFLLSSDKVVDLWNKIIEAGRPFGLLPIGLGARDTLRLEAALSLYGHEIDQKINPLEARLAWIVKLDKPDFIGKSSLQKIEKEGITRHLVGLSMIDAGIPRAGYEVYEGEKKLGWITSGTFSPSLGKAIALALIEGTKKSGDELLVGIRKQKARAQIVNLPFYRKKKGKI